MLKWPDRVTTNALDIFLSDLHLSAETPETTRAFFAFLDGPARAAGRVFILGDLFEYWAGDDDIEEPLNGEVATRLRALNDSGVELHFMAGNRDFVIGDAFCERCGMKILQDPTLIDTAGRRALLMHGDTLCTDDVKYQAWRAQARNPRFLGAFLAKPLAERKAFVAQVRAQSEAAKKEKPMEIMDVNDQAVRDAFIEYGCDLIIHGHTHRPDTHRYDIDGRQVERWVLSDWHGNAPCLVSTSGQLERIDFAS